MDKQTMALLVFGLIAAGFVVMFLLERRAAAKRLKARGGREIDVSSLIAFGSAAGEGEKTHH